MDGRNAVHGGRLSRRIRNCCRKCGVYYADAGRDARIVKVIFGMDVLPVGTPLGYYVCMYLWYCMVAFAHAIVLGQPL